MADTTDVAAAILAGGASRRMGTDKWQLRVDGVSLMERAIAAVSEHASDVLVVTAPHRPVDSADAVRVIIDERENVGPLAGIETALAHARAPMVIVVAVDHPWLDPDVLGLLIERLRSTDKDAVVLGTDDGPQPLVGAYRASALPALQRMLNGREHRVMRIVDHLDMQVIAPEEWRELDTHGRSAIDVDTPDDLATLGIADGQESAATTRRDAPLGQTAVTVTRHDSDGETPAQDTLVVERPIEIRAAGPGQTLQTLMTTLRTPGHDADLAAGWVYTEGFATAEAIEDITSGGPLETNRPEDRVTVQLRDTLDPQQSARRLAQATASCGVCGRASIDALAAHCTPIDVDDDPTRLAWDDAAALPSHLRAVQDVFAATGGIHATGIFTTNGATITVREDVGRHNALDAAIGAHVRNRTVPLAGHIAVLSGRIGFELVAKAAKAGIPIVLAVGAPTDLAVRTADRFGITLIGFVRAGCGNVYTHPQRITR